MTVAAGLLERVRRIATMLRADGRLLTLFLIMTVALFVFARLASEMLEGDTLAFDRHLMMVLRSPLDVALPIGPRWLRTAMVDLTALGGVSVLTVLTMIVAGYLLVGRKAVTALFVVVAVSGGAILSTLLKSQFARPRPDIVAHLVDVSTTSFPSGHAMNSAIVYLTLGALLARTQAERPPRIYILSVAIGLTLAIGASRVYLGVHWPSDVASGWMVGAVWAILCSIVASRLQRKAIVEPPTHTAE